MDDAAIEAYIAACRGRVDAFVQRHFAMAGTLAILRRTFIKDVIKYPINFFLSVPSLVVKNVADWLEMLGWDQLARLLAKLPLPLKMEFQAAVERLVIEELLDSPLGEVRECLNDPLKTYRSSRLTILDGANSGLAVLAGYVVFGDSSISPYAMGDKLAREHAKRDSASSFFLGSGAGSVFYSVFPPHPSFWQVCLATAAVVFGMSVLATVSSLLADPLQQTAGVHKRQLLRLIGSFEDRLVLHGRKSGSIALPIAAPPPVIEPAGPGLVAKMRHGLQHAVASLKTAYARMEDRYGKRHTMGALAATVCMVVIMVVVIADMLRFDPYRETRALIDVKAFPTAVARLDALARQGTYQKQAEYWYLRGQALSGQRSYDAAADAYRSALQHDASYRDDDTLIENLVDAVARGSNARAKALLVTEVGPHALPELIDASVAPEKIDRWSVVDIAEKLGGADRLDYPAITLADLTYTTTCAEKKRAIQKVGEHHVAAAKGALEDLDAQPQWRCLQPQLKTMLSELASR